MAESKVNWLKALTESKQIEAIFGEEVPSLEAVDLHELIVHRDGPRVILRFDLSTYPSHPPKKWSLQGYNRVQLQLMLVGISHFIVDGWGTNCVVDFDLVREGNVVKLIGSSGPTKIEIVANAALIESISAYRQEQ